MASESVKKVPIPRRGVDYRGKIVLAPMVRSGEMPARLLALHYGADLVWGPETVDRSMIGTTRRVDPSTKIVEFVRPSVTADPDSKLNVIYRLHPDLEGRSLIFQIGTSDPDRAVQAARTVAADVAGIDVNAGCPKPFSTHAGMGAALLQTPDKLVSILEALVREITPQHEIGISVKIRLLETAAKTEALVRRLVATGITGLTIHCRTTPMRPRERAIRGQLKMVADVCREAGVACLMNGDVESRDQALKLAAEYGADGAMIATAAEKNSSCFQSEADGGLLDWRIVAEKYLQITLDMENRYPNTKFTLANIVPGKKPDYKAVTQARSYTMLVKGLGFDNMLEQATDLDLKYDIDPEGMPKKEKGGKKKQQQQNSSALAAGGNMAAARSADQGSKKKILSERGVTATSETVQPVGAALTV